MLSNTVYTEAELDLLRLYTGREQKGNVPYRSKLDELLGINEFSHRFVNTFLGTGGREPPLKKIGVYKGEELRDFLRQIEVLFGIACKYGATHDLPSVLYREENQYKYILGDKTDTTGERIWITNSFKSCSKSRSETDVFKLSEEKGGSHKLCIKTSEKDSEFRRIPFINVNDLLKDGHVFDDEKEILLPPFLSMIIDKQTSNVPRNSLDINLEENDYIMHTTIGMSDPRNGEFVIPPFNCERDNMTDDELNLLVELQNKTNKTQEEEQNLEVLLNKMQTYIITRCRTIEALYMENPIIIEGKISQSNLGVLYYFLDGAVPEISKNGAAPEDSKKGTFYTFSDLVSNSGNKDLFKDIEVVPDEQLRITPELILSILNGNNERKVETSVQQLVKQSIGEISNVTLMDKTESHINNTQRNITEQEEITPEI